MGADARRGDAGQPVTDGDGLRSWTWGDLDPIRDRLVSREYGGWLAWSNC